MIKSNYIVYDCETGGLDETKNPITQYAAIVLDGKTLKEIDRWETFVKPYNDLIIEKESLERTMVSMSDINNGLSLKGFISTATEFWETHRVSTKKKEMGRLIPVGHNIPFDNSFINFALKLQNKPNITNWMYPNFIDTLSISKLAFGLTGEEKINLGASCERAKIKLTDAHGAMNDVEATSELLRWFMRKLRANKADIVSDVTKGRAKGNDFFEFKCCSK